MEIWNVIILNLKWHTVHLIMQQYFIVCTLFYHTGNRPTLLKEYSDGVG